jgi:hypothetical protein
MSTSKPYHLMTAEERITARIAANRAIEKKVAEGQAPVPETKQFSRVGHAFLDSLPDLDNSARAAKLLELGRMAKKGKK